VPTQIRRRRGVRPDEGEDSAGRGDGRVTGSQEETVGRRRRRGVRDGRAEGQDKGESQ